MVSAVSYTHLILFIDELHTIVGAGSAEGSMDASNIIKPALSRGELQACLLYTSGLARWNRKMDQLSSWARKELADIPEKARVLVTGHAAMNHFCREFGFRSISIQGISREDRCV